MVFTELKVGDTVILDSGNLTVTSEPEFDEGLQSYFVTSLFEDGSKTMFFGLEDTIVELYQ